MVFVVRSASVGLANGSVTQLRGQGPRAEAVAARRLPRERRSSNPRSAAGVTPRRWRSPRWSGWRAEAGPRQLHREVSPRVQPRA